MMQLIFDAVAQKGYPVGKEGFAGGTELMLHKIAAGLARNHIVHVVTPDLEVMEQRAERLFYWPPQGHPDKADAVVMVHDLAHIDPYSAKLLIWASNGLGAYLGPGDEFATGVDAVACFSRCHVDLLCGRHPKVPREKCHITGLGVDLDDYMPYRPTLETKSLGAHVDADGTFVTESSYRMRDTKVEKIPGRFLYANAPERGLLTTLKIFQLIQREVPEASLHISYDWSRVFDANKWNANAIAEALWECKELIETIPNVTDVGALDRAGVIREQLECQIHLYPSSPPNIGSQIHGIAQMECAAAGCALVLSEFEAFPEVFGGAAQILPLPGQLDPHTESRWTIQDWADIAVSILTDPLSQGLCANLSKKARALAERNTWGHVVANWEAMLAELSGEGGVTR